MRLTVVPQNCQFSFQGQNLNLRGQGYIGPEAKATIGLEATSISLAV